MDTFSVTSPAFQHAGTIPAVYTCEGRDISPPFQWRSVPAGTRSFAISCVDPDAPLGDWIHWIAWDIPPDSTGLPEGAATAAGGPMVQGTNSWGRTGYGGPCPPRGHGMHRYFFTVYALKVSQLKLDPRSRLPEFEKKIADHILAEATVMGKYARK